MTRFQISSLAEYERSYSQLGAALGVPNAIPAPGEVDFLAELTARDWRRIAMLPRPDVFFAAAVASIVASPRALEIGTASGFSAALIAQILALREAERGARGTEPLVHTVDRKAAFVFDPTQPVGFAIGLVAAGLRDRIVVHAEKDSSLCASLPGTDAVRFAFIDGNHQHPWPLADALRLQRLMPGGWLLLHDIDLPATISQAQARGRALGCSPDHGAKHVFDFWPDEKVSAGNIGAVRVPSDRRVLADLVRELRGRPAEVSPGSWAKLWHEIDALEKKLLRCH